MQLKFSQRITTMSLMFLFGIGWISAHNAVRFITGDTVETIIMLQEHPKVSVENDNLKLTTDNSVLEFNWNSEAQFEFLDYEQSGISDIADAIPVINFAPEWLECANLTPEKQVTISDLSGKTMISTLTGKDGKIVINLSELPAGVYIFNSINKQFKFYKK